MNREHFRRIVIFFLTVLIIAAQTAIFFYYWSVYYNPYIQRTFVLKGQIVMILLYDLMLLGFSRVYGGFKVSNLRTTDVIFSQSLSTVFVNILAYLQICMLSLRLVSVIPMISMTLMDVSAIILWAVFARYVYTLLYPARDILLVYCDRDPDNLVKKMNARADKYKIEDSIHIDVGFEKLTQVIDKHKAILLCDIPGDIRNDLIKYGFSKGIRVYITPKLSDIILMGADNIHLFDTPLLLAKNEGFSAERRFTKRFVDLFVSTIMAIITAPFMLLFAIIIKCTDGGPVLYKQQRLTQGGRVFNVLKFRSMRVDSEKEGARLAAKGDDRVTPIGRFLRACHLDELPQIYNIWMGDMSLVGPRPERPEIAKQYLDSIPEFDFRLKVKAGLTGYAQIYGKYNTTPYDKLKLDLYYIEHQNFLLDLRLIMMTVKILFVKDNTEGVESWQKTATITDGSVGKEEKN